MVVAMGKDFSRYTCEQWAALGATFPIIDDRSSEIWKLFGNGAVPRNIIMDNTGKLYYSKTGYNESEVTAILDSLLATQSVDPTQTPHSARLISAYPNPFNAGTRIEFELDHAEAVQLIIYDAAGKKVKTLHSGFHSEGQHTLRWDGENDEGRLISSGVYLVRLQTSGSSSSKKILYLK